MQNILLTGIKLIILLKVSVSPIVQREIIFTELRVGLVTKHQLPVDLGETTFKINNPMVRHNLNPGSVSQGWAEM